MTILTIKDVEKATDKVLEETKREITLLSDLGEFQQWLIEHEEKIDIHARLGGGQRSLSIHPSSLSKVGVCPLRIYYELTGEVMQASKFDQDMQDLFDLGTLYHFATQAQFHAMYQDQFQSEVPMELPELRMTGSADGLFTFPNVKFVLEIKTIKDGDGPYAFGRLSHTPLTDHIRQATCYMHMLDVPFALLWYYNKNNSMKVEHVVKYDPVVWQDLYHLAKSVVDAANGGQMVRAKPGIECNRCGFAHGCDACRSASGIRSDRRRGKRVV